MTREVAASTAADRADRTTRIVRLLSIAALVVGAVLYWRGLWRNPEFTRVPLQPLVLSPERPRVPAIPASFGALAGQNLILVTLDTTRADRIGCYGNAAIATPNLDRLANDGVVFTRAVATASSTLPAHASILTGLYPHRHGARANSLFRLGEPHRTLAQVLSERGYRTAAFVSSLVLDARYGLDRGFDVYDDSASSQSGDFMFAERRGDETTDRAIAWLRASPRDPFFLWIHYFDPHARYEPPEPFASQYALPYDGEIAFVDQQIGRLLEAAGERDALVVITADHGEAFGEHGEELHAQLVQEATIQVPLIFHAKRGLPGGVQVDARASQIDVLPTVSTLLGIPAPEGLDGVDLTRPPSAQRAVMAETLEGRVNFGWARLSALYEGPWKLVDGPRPELYDLSRDPIGHVDLAREHPEQLSRLQDRLAELRGGDGDLLAPSRHDLGAAEIERLESLGYAVGGATGGTLAAGGPGPDPHEQLPLLSQVDLMSQAPLRADAIRRLEAFADEHPDFAPTFLALKSLYNREKRPAEARRALTRLRSIMQTSAGGGAAPRRP